ncbi:MAG: 4Fe-4S dicluster domain-containing protein [Leptospiraceae bacterium]|nr:4Fe-4S dicluster domain-containing protein [Leptospiraceae bacterium]
MKQIGFLLDVDKCIGCNSCRVSCQIHNNSSPFVNWRQITSFESGKFPETFQYNLSIACNHCKDPACMKVCPVNAIHKREKDGIVYIESATCNGCDRCIGACPYGAPQKRLDRKVSKCDFCKARQDNGEIPVCVETCVGGALQFGELKNLEKIVKGKKLHREISGFPNPELTSPSIRFLKPRQLK